MRAHGFWLLLLAVAFPTMVQAKIFRNAYVAFELPDIWNCTLEHTEWVCRSSNDKESKEAKFKTNQQRTIGRSKTR